MYSIKKLPNEFMPPDIQVAVLEFIVTRTLFCRTIWWHSEADSWLFGYKCHYSSSPCEHLCQVWRNSFKVFLRYNVHYKIAKGFRVHFQQNFQLWADRYLSHDSFIVDVEAELPQAVSTKCHLWSLTTLGKELDIGRAERCKKVQMRVAMKVMIRWGMIKKIKKKPVKRWREKNAQKRRQLKLKDIKMVANLFSTTSDKFTQPQFCVEIFILNSREK